MEINRSKAIERIARILLGEDVQTLSKVHQPKAEKSAASDRVTLSVHADGLQDVVAKVNQTPDVRTARVQELREAIRSGAYHVDSAAIAEKMLAEGRIAPPGRD